MDVRLDIIRLRLLLRIKSIPLFVHLYELFATLFGLKNAGITYQRAMIYIFNILIHKLVESYVNDLIVKSRSRMDHLDDLRTVFIRLREYSLKINPLKYAFGVSSCKFLSFVVKHRSIEIDPSKIKVIIEILPPANLK